MDPKSYIIATIKPWNLKVFEERFARRSETWHLVTSPLELTLETLRRVKPRYVFFPHWSAKVPSEILAEVECVCFHETNVPYGRGGSPIQNLIARGHRETSVTALRMSDELDAGPIYLQRPLSLEGLGEEIFIRASRLVAEMIEEIVRTEPTPRPQAGDVVVFKRRTPSDSELPRDISDLSKLFDHLRMLDAETYPPAFLDYGDFRLEFRRPALRSRAIEADVRITVRPREKP